MFGRSEAERAERAQETLVAAGDYLVAGITADDAAADNALSRADALMLQAAVIDIAERAISALAHDRGVGVDQIVAYLIATQPAENRRSER